MSLCPAAIEPVPKQTKRVARLAFPNGNLYMKMRDELGTFFTDDDFADLYPRRGQPAFAPWRLALVTVMQFMENLSDRQAADAMRARIDWKYALGLELTDPGFDFSILCEFRKRLTQEKAQHLLLDRLLSVFQNKKMLKARSRQRTDSTHVLAAIHNMNRLELVTETLRAALNALAAQAPDWLRGAVPAEWQQQYVRRAEQMRLPRTDTARDDYAQQVGRDGVVLLWLVDKQQPDLAGLAALETLRKVWGRHFVPSDITGRAWRKDADLCRAATAVESPYDIEARHSSKRETVWTGYKAHVTETCDPALPRLIIHVHTTVATLQDVTCTAGIQQALAEKGLLPRRHFVDTGYIDAELLVSSREQHGIDLFGPPREAQSWQARTGGYDHSRFSIDWDNQQATCPEGKTSRSWASYLRKPYNRPVVTVRFASQDCTGCASRKQCVSSPAGQGRTLVMPERAEAEALDAARRVLSSEAGRFEYGLRAGVEGTISQAVRRSGLRRARYRGLTKTHLQHLATAAGLNVVRAVNHLNGVPLAPTRSSRFAQLFA